MNRGFAIEARHNWYEIDSRWLYFGLFDQKLLNDPLLGERGNIEEWINNRHRHPGHAVKLGPQIVSWGKANAQYIFLNS